MTPLEIERVWILDRWPDVPEGAEVWEIEQGYLPQSVDPEDPDFPEGRIRRIRTNGRVRCRHTVKRGAGLIREEIERTIDEAEFERLWPSTEGRRIVKTRWRVRAGERIWELDRFRDLPLFLAEVELPQSHAVAAPPAWLAPCLGREVTYDPRYRNFALAVVGIPDGISRAPESGSSQESREAPR